MQLLLLNNFHYCKNDQYCFIKSKHFINFYNSVAKVFLGGIKDMEGN